MKRALAVGLMVLFVSACQLEEQGAQGISHANTVTCSAEREMLGKAVEIYFTLQGENPANEAALVPGYLHTESALMDLDANAAVVPAPGSGCP